MICAKLSTVVVMIFHVRATHICRWFGLWAHKHFMEWVQGSMVNKLAAESMIDKVGSRIIGMAYRPLWSWHLTAPPSPVLNNLSADDVNQSCTEPFLLWMLLWYDNGVTILYIPCIFCEAIVHAACFAYFIPIFDLVFVDEKSENRN